MGAHRPPGCTMACIAAAAGRWTCAATQPTVHPTQLPSLLLRLLLGLRQRPTVLHGHKVAPRPIAVAAAAALPAGWQQHLAACPAPACPCQPSSIVAGRQWAHRRLTRPSNCACRSRSRPPCRLAMGQQPASHRMKWELCHGCSPGSAQQPFAGRLQRRRRRQAAAAAMAGFGACNSPGLPDRATHGEPASAPAARGL